jgi:hypothetical protein
MSGVIDRIKNITARYHFKKEMAGHKRHKQFVSLATAKYVGLAYYLDNDQTYSVVSSFVKSLQDKQIKVKAMGYVRDKYMTQRYLPKMTFDFFYEKDLNWFHRPGGNYVKDFLNEEFDIFIDLTIEEQMPIQYISGKANARFKVGRYCEANKDIFDMLIKVEEGSGIDRLINEINHYLTIINPH